MVLPEMADGGHAEVAFFRDDETGLECIVAIYDADRQPAVGGTRMYDYASEAEALEDALRLSKAMAYKTAAAGFDEGGGKGVILGDPVTDKDEALLRAYGRVVDGMRGAFHTGVDMNITTEDVSVMGTETSYVGGTEGGRLAERTARGVVAGMRACLREQYGTASFADVTVVVQGLGKVGAPLAEQLVDRGCEVAVADLDERRVDELTARHDVAVIDPDAVYDEPCDVFAPCATGAVVNDRTVPRLQCDIVAGSANNVLAEDRHAAALEERGILYAPDFVVNAGGLIAGLGGTLGLSDAEIDARIDDIETRLEEIFERRDREDVSTAVAANRYAEDRM